MNALARALWAETLKTKRTLALAVTVLAPLAIGVLMVAMYLEHAEYYAVPKGENPWIRYTQTCLVWWSLLMLPLFITLETALINGLDHSPRSWKMLYTTPIPRWAFYAAKQIISMGLIALSMIFMVVVIFLVSFLLRAIRPVYDFSAPVPWLHVLKYITLPYIAAWLIISLHFFISARWKSFVIAIGVGMCATVAAIFFVGRDYAMFYPWTMPAFPVAKMLDDANQIATLAMGGLGGIVVALIGGWNVTRQDVL